MPTKYLTEQELRVWQAFQFMNEDVLSRVGRDIAQATGLSGPEYGVLSRLAAFGRGEMRQQALAQVMNWDKSRLSHQLKRMEQRELVERRPGGSKEVIVTISASGKEMLSAALPVHARSVRKNLLSRLNPEQLAMIVRISNLLDEDEAG